MKLKSTLIGALVATGMMAGAAQAVTSEFLFGTFTVKVANFNAGGVRREAFAGIKNLNNKLDDTFTYTGLLNFHLGGGNSPTTTIRNFLDSGTGTVSGLDTAVGNSILSTPTFQQTTLFLFTATDLGGFAGEFRHDDGIKFFDNGTREVNSPAPTTVKRTAFDFSGGKFELLYAAANGNPSVLEARGLPAPVPLPAALPLLLAGIGGLGMMRRRKTKAA